MARTRFRVSGVIPSGMDGRALSAAGYAVDKFAYTATVTGIVADATVSSNAVITVTSALPATVSAMDTFPITGSAVGRYNQTYTIASIATDRLSVVATPATVIDFGNPFTGTAVINTAGFLTESTDAEVQLALDTAQQNAAVFRHVDDSRTTVASQRSLFINSDIVISSSIVFKNTDVLINGGSLRVTGAGVHAYFINCNIVLVNEKAASPPIIFGVDDRTVASGGLSGDVESTSRSLNLYGCNIYDATHVGSSYPSEPNFKPGVARATLIFSDFIQSTYTFTSWGTDNYQVQLGSRLLNSTILAPNIFEANPYQTSGGRLTQETMAYDNVTLIPSVTGTTARSTVLRNPNFTNPGQLEYYSFDAPPVSNGGPLLDDSPLLVINGPSFGPSGVNPSGVFSGVDRGLIGSANTANLRRGVYNYLEFAPTIFTNALARTQDIAAAGEVSVFINGRISNNAYNQSSFGRAARYMFDGELITVTNEFVTNNAGRIVSSQYSAIADNGTVITTPTAGYFDWLSLTVRTTAGSDNLGQTREGELLPDNLAPVLLGFAKRSDFNGSDLDTTNTTGTGYSNNVINIDPRIEFRSYRYNVPDEFSRNITIPDRGANIEPINQNIIVEDLITSLVQTPTVTAARALLNTAGPKSMQNIADITRANWADRTIPPERYEPTISGDILNLPFPNTSQLVQNNIILTISRSTPGFTFSESNNRVTLRYGGVTGLTASDGDFVKGIMPTDISTTQSQNRFNAFLDFYDGITIGGPNYTLYGMPTSPSGPQVESFTTRISLSQSEGMHNVTFHRQGAYNFSYNGSAPAYVYIHNPQFIGTGTAPITFNNQGSGTVYLAFTDAFGQPAAGSPGANITPGTRVEYEPLPPAQPTRLFVDMANLPRGARYALIQQPASGTPIDPTSDVIVQGVVGTGTGQEDYIALSGTAVAAGEALIPDSRPTTSITFASTNASYDSIFRPGNTTASTTLMLVVTHKNTRSSLYDIRVNVNNTAATMAQMINNQYNPTPGTDESLQLADDTNFNGNVRTAIVSNTLGTHGNQNTLPMTGAGSNGAIIFDIQGMGNLQMSGGNTLRRPTEADAQLVLATARGTQQYPLAIGELYRIVNGNLVPTIGDAPIIFDVMRFVNSRNVDVTPRVLFIDSVNPNVQFLPGVYRTADDEFTPLPEEEAFTLYTSTQTVLIAGGQITEETVISERRQATDVTNSTIQTELNSRHLRSGSLVNIGLGLPAVDENNNLLTTPTLP